ncbi:MAG: hypothetical protein J4203_06705 [Candidatus Diapherotrites archaeon]|uniref:HEAT repeat domain-containing protein n=1 Tax=Candidatus Iainarchaeum sp. TaxID=3101447 RepID=A0A8T4L8H7_9ARCH|nr:hypothetical protein [Candidatus Diapherotrites archaeon]
MSVPSRLNRVGRLEVDRRGRVRTVSSFVRTKEGRVKKRWRAPSQEELEAALERFTRLALNGNTRASMAAVNQINRVLYSKESHGIQAHALLKLGLLASHGNRFAIRAVANALLHENFSIRAYAQSYLSDTVSPQNRKLVLDAVEQAKNRLKKGSTEREALLVFHRALEIRQEPTGRARQLPLFEQ